MAADAPSKPAAESPPPEPWVLTQLGPAVLLEEKGDMVRARLRWGATLSAPVASVRRELDVRVWSFVAGKQQFSTRVTLAQTVGELRARAAKHLGVEPAEARLVVRGHELTVEPDEKPLGACNVQWREPFEVLVVIDEKHRIAFSPLLCPPVLRISDDGQSVVMQTASEGEDATVLAMPALNSGRIFWEVRLHTRDAASRVNLGVAVSALNQHTYVGSDRNGWSVYGCNGKSETGGDSIDFMEPFGRGDTVRLALDMDERTLHVSKNGMDFGVAHRNLPDVVHPAFSLFFSGDRLELVKSGTW